MWTCCRVEQTGRADIWNLKGEKQREANKKRIQDNAFLDKVKARAREIIEKFEIDGIDWTLNQFEETFLNPSKQGKF